MGATGGQAFLENRLEVKTVDSESLAPNTPPPPLSLESLTISTVWVGVGMRDLMTIECGNGYFIFYFKERVTDGLIHSHS